MSPKAKKEVAVKADKKSATKSAPAKAATQSLKGPAKSSAKVSAKSSKASEEIAPPVVDADEMEEQEEAAAVSSSSGGGNAAALAAASGATEMSASFKNFRHHPDMENFYRFIYDNDLRHEALAIIDEIQLEKSKRKLMKGAKANAH
jgi:hypothetical protein